MSVSLINNRKSAPKWEPNIAQWNLCGAINALAGAPFRIDPGTIAFSFMEKDRAMAFRFARPPYDGGANQTREWAEIISDQLLSDDELAKKHMTLLASLYPTLDVIEIGEYVKEYVNWLNKCGGYKVAP